MEKWKISDLVYGVLIPTVVGFTIIGIEMSSSPLFIGLKYTLLEAIVVVGVPMLVGLIWNQWAGGTAGFIMGSFYGLYFSDQLCAAQNLGDISLLGNLVSAMLIGYIAGALNKRSDSYRIMLISGIIAGTVASLPLLFTSQYSKVLGGLTVGGAVLALLPRIFAAVVMPLIARAFLRHAAKQETS